MITSTTNLDYLIENVRIHLSDLDSTSYRYTDAWIRTAIVSAVKALQRWWGDKYIINDTTYNVSRNSNFSYFTFDSPPIIEHRDERPIVLMASIFIKSGQLEANSWGVGSWRDAEIAVSNIEGNKAKTFSLKMDWEELKDYLRPPTKRLYPAIKTSYPERT